MAYSGAFHRDEKPQDRESPAEEAEQTMQRSKEKRPGFDLGGILKKIEAAGMETDDLLMALILFLMYRESGDTDLLIMLGVMLLT